MTPLSCPICGGTEALPWCRTWDFHFVIPGYFEVWQCRECGSGFLPPGQETLTASLASYRTDGYWGVDLDHWGELPAQDREAIIFGKLRGGARNVHHLRKVFGPEFPPSGDLLEVGCGTGELSASLRAAGYQVTSVERSTEAARFARNNFGVDVLEGDWLEVPLERERYDVCLFPGSLEHIPEPRQVLERAWEALRPGGRVVIITQNFETPLARWMKGWWMSLDAPRHLYHFTGNSLHTLLEHTGFEVKPCPMELFFYPFATAASSLWNGVQLVSKRFNGRTLSWKTPLGWWKGFPVYLAALPLALAAYALGPSELLTVVGVKKSTWSPQDF